MDRIKKLVKEKLCKKGEAYRKRRMAAGEKSSAYLSGRAVKVCNGTMSGKKKKKTNEQEEKSNRVAEAALILPRGKKVVLQAEEDDYKRGLIVELTNEGGYKINYWYGDDVKIYPAEVEVDGKSIKDDANEVYIKFHPELDGGKLNEDLFGKYATRKAPRDTTDKNNPDYTLYMGNDDPEYRRFYMALKRLIEKSAKNLDQNFEILDWIESLLNNIRPGK